MNDLVKWPILNGMILCSHQRYMGNYGGVTQKPQKIDKKIENFICRTS